MKSSLRLTRKSVFVEESKSVCVYDPVEKRDFLFTTLLAMAKSMFIVAFLLIACMTIMHVSGFTDEAGNDCPCATTDDLRWVCGSDGVSYPNRAHLDCENKCKRSSIELKHEGQC